MPRRRSRRVIPAAIDNAVTLRPALGEQVPSSSPKSGRYSGTGSGFGLVAGFDLGAGLGFAFLVAVPSGFGLVAGFDLGAGLGFAFLVAVPATNLSTARARRLWLRLASLASGPLHRYGG